MAKHSNDIVQAIVDGVDDLTLDAIIQEYLETPDNGFLDKTTTPVTIVNGDETNLITNRYWDGFSWIEVPYIYPSTFDSTIDSTATLTVSQWKDVYLEEYNNEAIRTMKGIITTDTDGNILVGKDYRILVDESFTTYIQYTIAVPITVPVSNETIEGIDYINYPGGITTPVPWNTWKYITYEYPDQRTFIGASVSITGDTLYLPYFVGFSDNGVDWTWIYADEFTGVPTETNDYDYPSNYYFFVNSTKDEHVTINLPKARKARFMRLYFSGKSAIITQDSPTQYTYTYQNNVRIANVTFQEVVEGKTIREESTPTSKLEETSIAAQVSDTAVASGSISATDWTTVGGSNTQVPVACLFNEECRVTSNGGGTLYARIWDGSTVIDEGSLTSAGSLQLFNRNVQLIAYENVTRYIQLKTDGSNIGYSIKYQNTRHGF